MALLQLEVIFKKATRKSDDSVTLSFETQLEQTTEQFSYIDGFRKKTGFLVFKDDAIVAKDIPIGRTSQKGKTPSQQLRASLYATWKFKTDHGHITEEWDTYYENAIMGFKTAVDKSYPGRD